MKKIYIFIEGSNDLFYLLNKSLCKLLYDISNSKNIRIDILFSLNNIDLMKLWKNISDQYSLNRNFGLIRIRDKGFNYIEDVRYLREYKLEDKTIKFIDINKYLKDNISNKDENIVIISGHGGPFQCLLNMNKDYPASLNTRKFCRELSEYNIDVLYLDMCAMNYIDTIYELICKNNIKNIITYKGLAPYKSLDYMEFIDIINSEKPLEDTIKEYVNTSNLPLIYLNKYSINPLEECKSLFNNMAKMCFANKISNLDHDIDKLKRRIVKSVYEGTKSRFINELPLKIFKYSLADRVDRIIFNNYKFEIDNLYRYLISKDENEKEPDIIFLSEESLTHIIGLHNPEFSEKKIDYIKDKLITHYNQ